MAMMATNRITLSRFSNGRRLLVLNALRPLVAEHGNAELAAAVEKARSYERATRKLERKWRKLRKSRTRARGKAREIDLQLDRIISTMYAALSSRLAPLDPESELAVKIQALMEDYFPEGVQGITQAEYDDALAIIEEMNEYFGELSEEELKQLAIEHHVAELQRLAPLFATELNKTGEGFQFKTLQDARLEGHEQLCEIVAGILFFTRDRDDEGQLRSRAALLAPVIAADERVKARRKRRNGPDVEVNPITGEELDADDELEDLDEEDTVQDLDSDPTGSV